MTLLRIGIAFLAVAGLFVGVAWASGARTRGNVVASAAEGLVLTLLGALWFGSLGHGGWVLVFLLIGVLASGSGHRAERGGTTGLIRITAVTALRYVAAGTLLALILA